MRWIVGPNDGSTVRHVLARANADADAVLEGRVFIGRQRVRSGTEPVREGDVVEIAQPRSTAECIRILARTTDLVAVDKPAGIPTIPDHSGAAHSLVSLAARTLGIADSELHPTSRLDRDVSGVVILARTPDAARRLAQARAHGEYERRYVAIATAAPDGESGTWDAPIGRARDPRKRAVGGRGAIDASTRYLVCGRTDGVAVLLAVAPITGRTHQIRVHAANAGAPLFGDRGYGGQSRTTLQSGRVIELGRIALHAARVIVPNEDCGRLDVRAPIPADLIHFWSELGGDTTAWDLAISCALR